MWCTILTKKTAWISGGWTGSRAVIIGGSTNPTKTASLKTAGKYSIPFGCSTTCIL